MCSTSAVEARPVRTLTRSWRRASMLLAMRACASLWMVSIMGIPVPGSAPGVQPSVPVRGAVVAVVQAGAAELDLQRGVVDAETRVQLAMDVVQERVVAVAAGPHQVCGHRDLARAQRPVVHLVHRADAGLRLQLHP